MTLDWKFSFGKFKGKSLKYVMEECPSYLNFVLEINWFSEKIKKEMTMEDATSLYQARANYNIRQDRDYNFQGNLDEDEVYGVNYDSSLKL